MFLIEVALVLFAAVVGFTFPDVGSRSFQPIERGFARLARRRALAVFLVGTAALVLRAALLPIEPIPEPTAQDEFSYLLAADTFAHGRVTNPTHPMWIHFETFHVIQKPTYTSIYYPAQGLFLAIGQVLLGQAFWGAWLSVGLMCAAICWMLQSWLSPIWALLGGLIAVVRLGSFSYWANSYWGGAVAATGGALVLGALPRIKRHQRPRDALLLGVGLALLANSRPYESLFFSLPVGIALLFWIVSKKAPPLWSSMRLIVLPLVLVIALTAAGMGYYFWRTTGSAVQIPYLIELRTYNPVPFFPWQHLKPLPEYHHSEMRNFYAGWWLHQYELERQHPVLVRLITVGVWWLFYLGPVLTLPLILFLGRVHNSLPYRNISRKTRFLLAVWGTAFIGSMLPGYFMPHYVAPLTAAIYALLLISLRWLRRWRWRNKLVGLAMVRAVPTICILLLLLRASLSVIPIAPPPQFPPSWCSRAPQLTERARISDRLERLPGLHLLIVRYGPDHDPAQEWVYNKASIDDAKIVWARDITPAQNEKLVRYYSGRTVWLLEPDKSPAKLSPYHDADPHGVGPLAIKNSSENEDGDTRIPLEPRVSSSGVSKAKWTFPTDLSVLRSALVRARSESVLIKAQLFPWSSPEVPGRF